MSRKKCAKKMHKIRGLGGGGERTRKSPPDVPAMAEARLVEEAGIKVD